MPEGNYGNGIKYLNSLFEDEVSKHKNCFFISNWNLLADKEGNYSAYLPDLKGINQLARVSDGIHLTYFGGNILVKNAVKIITEKINLVI